MGPHHWLGGPYRIKSSLRLGSTLTHSGRYKSTGFCPLSCNKAQNGAFAGPAKRARLALHTPIVSKSSPNNGPSVHEDHQGRRKKCIAQPTQVAVFGANTHFASLWAMTSLRKSWRLGQISFCILACVCCHNIPSCTPHGGYHGVTIVAKNAATGKKLHKHSSHSAHTNPVEPWPENTSAQIRDFPPKIVGEVIFASFF